MMFTHDQIARGKVIATSIERPADVPAGCALDYRRLPDGQWYRCTIIPATAAEAPKPHAHPTGTQAPRQPQPVPGGWWVQPVRFLQPKAERPRYRPAAALQLAVGIPVAIGVGLIASRILHSGPGKHVIKSVVRAVIYAAVIIPLLRMSG